MAVGEVASSWVAVVAVVGAALVGVVAAVASSWHAASSWRAASSSSCGFFLAVVGSAVVRVVAVVAVVGAPSSHVWQD